MADGLPKREFYLAGPKVDDVKGLAMLGGAIVFGAIVWAVDPSGFDVFLAQVLIFICVIAGANRALNAFKAMRRPILTITDKYFEYDGAVMTWWTFRGVILVKVGSKMLCGMDPLDEEQLARNVSDEMRRRVRGTMKRYGVALIVPELKGVTPPQLRSVIEHYRSEATLNLDPTDPRYVRG